MSDDAEKASRDMEEMVNMLAWPGPIEEGMITAHIARETQENQDQLRLSVQPNVTGPLDTFRRKSSGSFNAGWVIILVAFFIVLLWIFIQDLPSGSP